VASRASEWAATDWQGLLTVPAGGRRQPRLRLRTWDRALERYHSGDLSGSIAELERAVAENPGYADVRGRLGGLLLEARRIEERSSSWTTRCASTRATSRPACWLRAPSSSWAEHARDRAPRGRA